SIKAGRTDHVRILQEEESPERPRRIHFRRLRQSTTGQARRPRTGDYLGERTPHGRCASAGSPHSCSRYRGRVDSVFHTRPSAFGRSKLLQAARVYSATFHGPTFSPDESTPMVQGGLGCWP